MRCRSKPESFSAVVKHGHISIPFKKHSVHVCQMANACLNFTCQNASIFNADESWQLHMHHHHPSSGLMPTYVRFSGVRQTARHVDEPGFPNCFLNIKQTELLRPMIFAINYCEKNRWQPNQHLTVVVAVEHAENPPFFSTRNTSRTKLIIALFGSL